MIIVNLVLSWRRLIKTKTSTEKPDVYFQANFWPEAFSVKYIIFHAGKIRAVGERCLLTKTGFFTSLLVSQALPSLRPSQSGPGHRPQWSKKKNRLHQEEGNSNVNQVNLMDFKSGFSKKKTSLMEVGTCSFDMSPTSTGAKWLSPMLTLALVVPCWLDQLTIREVQFLLEPSELNEYQDISYHQ